MPEDLLTLEKLSVQEHEPKTSVGSSYYWFVGDDLSQPTDLLPTWGLPARDRALRLLYRGVYAWIAQAAVASVVKKVKQTPWQVQGGRNLTTYYQSVLQDADFGDGWGMFLSRVILDFLTCDYGAFIELIGRGDPDKPLRGRVMGIAHLDSLRCQPTGNNEYPVVYWARRTGKMHRLHQTRVLRLVDMPDGDENRFGCGLSAMSRAVSALAQQVGAQRYVAGMMSEQPPAGILYNVGMTQPQWNDAYDKYLAMQRTGYKGFMQISGTDPNLGGEVLKFAAAPEGFDYAGYTEIAVNIFAATFGIDRQDIWPLTGRMAGTATQSDILNEKARGMMYGDILQSLERSLNTHVLPKALEFQFTPKDEEGDQQRAERLQAIVTIGSDLKAKVGLSQTQVLQFLAQQSEELRDILTDENGQIVELPDNDVQESGDEDVIEEDAGNITAPDAATTQDDETPDTQQSVEKAIQSTRIEFELDFADAVAAAQNDAVNRKWFGITLRQLISDYGLKAYIDGLKDGGVNTATLDGDDVNSYAQLVAGQAGYIRNFADAIFDGTDYTPEIRAEMWYTKSISPFYYAGLASADRNGMYEFAGDDGEESCPDCIRLKGQLHRMKDWTRKQLRPGVDTDNFECKGFHCHHKLVKKPGARARGKF